MLILTLQMSLFLSLGHHHHHQKQKARIKLTLSQTIENLGNVCTGMNPKSTEFLLDRQTGCIAIYPHSTPGKKNPPSWRSHLKSTSELGGQSLTMQKVDFNCIPGLWESVTPRRKSKQRLRIWQHSIEISIV